MQPLNITAHTTLEIDGKEYAATVSATLFPAHFADRDDDGGEQEIELNYVEYDDVTIFNLKRNLTSENLDRCLEAVNAKIEY